jgi:hypothetical protein
VVISREREKATMNALLVKGNRITGWLGRRSIDILRISLGLVFLAFGILKFKDIVLAAAGLVIAARALAAAPLERLSV